MNKIITGKYIKSAAVFLLGVALVGSPAYSEILVSGTDKIKCFVSILPQAYFVERIGGKIVDVSVIVGAGHSPATYEPTPRQMAELSKARLYFRIGVPFEDVWIKRIGKSNPDMKVIDTRQGIRLRSLKTRHDHENTSSGHDNTEEIKDPHTWLSLRLVKVQAQNIAAALISEDPGRRTYYEDNLKAFHQDLDRLDLNIQRTLEKLKTRRFMVFHPAWGYFAADYGLEQVPVEVEGKEPSARTLAKIVDRAKQEGIKIVFVQAQFSTRNAETVAGAIGGRTVKIDPLARDYLKSMKKIAETIALILKAES